MNVIAINKPVTPRQIRKFIRENWQTMKDVKIGETLGISRERVEAMRRKMGFRKYRKIRSDAKNMLGRAAAKRTRVTPPLHRFIKTFYQLDILAA